MSESPTPPDVEPDGNAYSNFDHLLEDDAEKRLRAGKILIHAAHDFNGTIWFVDGTFYEQVWKYNALIETLSDETLPGVIEKANDEYGTK